MSIPPLPRTQRANHLLIQLFDAADPATGLVNISGIPQETVLDAVAYRADLVVLADDAGIKLTRRERAIIVDRIREAYRKETGNQGLLDKIDMKKIRERALKEIKEFETEK
ncbi:hypothetical protein AX15_006090 [Amanita polypyramis BW_CC]|nr:hypothetical protein AX15_006090 [Amanita polypyramis BW_CC]